MIIDTINSDLKKAMLAGDKLRVDVLKSIKTAIQYESLRKTAKEELSEDETISILKKEQKKRSEAAELYQKANDSQRAGKELHEKEVLSKYLPPEMDEAEINNLLDREIAKAGGLDSKNMGRIIGGLKQACGPAADGALIAKLVKARLT